MESTFFLTVTVTISLFTILYFLFTIHYSLAKRIHYSLVKRIHYSLAKLFDMLQLQSDLKLKTIARINNNSGMTSDWFLS